MLENNVERSLAVNAATDIWIIIKEFLGMLAIVLEERL